MFAGVPAHDAAQGGIGFDARRHHAESWHCAAADGCPGCPRGPGSFYSLSPYNIEISLTTAYRKLGHLGQLGQNLGTTSREY